MSNKVTIIAVVLFIIRRMVVANSTILLVKADYMYHLITLT